VARKKKYLPGGKSGHQPARKKREEGTKKKNRGEGKKGYPVIAQRMYKALLDCH